MSDAPTTQPVTPQQIPTLLAHLLVEYAKVSPDPNRVGKARAFIGWAERYLAQTNPPVSAWFPGAGVGLIMADQTRLVVAASAVPSRTGDMQNSGTVPITRGDGFGGIQI